VTQFVHNKLYKFIKKYKTEEIHFMVIGYKDRVHKPNFLEDTKIEIIKFKIDYKLN